MGGEMVENGLRTPVDLDREVYTIFRPLPRQGGPSWKSLVQELAVGRLRFEKTRKGTAQFLSRHGFSRTVTSSSVLDPTDGKSASTLVGSSSNSESTIILRLTNPPSPLQTDQRHNPPDTSPIPFSTPPSAPSPPHLPPHKRPRTYFSAAVSSPSPPPKTPSAHLS